LVIALVGTGMMTVMLVALLRLAAAESRGLKSDAWKEQAEWLAESGAERAAARLADDPEYRGETWRIPPEAFGGSNGAVVLIEVQSPPGPGPSERRVVRARADFPDDPQRRARKSKTIVVLLSPSS
jgi:hypothetical protein